MSVQASSGVLSALSTEIASTIERAEQSIVTVHGRRRLACTGIVWPGTGEPNVIVTADHGIEQDEGITVTLADGQRVGAVVVGRDPGSDIAVLRVPGTSLSPVELAPAGSLKVGNLVVAVGRAHRLTASWGIVGAVGETWRTPRGAVNEGYIRADLTLYPGYSGGPMLDASGRVAGMNTSQLWRGHGIAVAANAVQTAVETLLTHGRIQRGYLGISSRPVLLPTAMREAAGLTQETGLLVMGVESDSPADTGGILVGDIVVALGGRSTTDPEDLQAALDPASVGKETDVTVIRGGQRKELRFTVGARQ